MACSRLRAGSCDRGAAADPRAATSGQLTQPASRARRLPQASWRRLRRHQEGDRAGPDPEPPARSPGCPGARGRDAGGVRTYPRGWPLPRSQRLAQLAEDFRYEEAARLRDRIDALEQIVIACADSRSCTLERCLIVPALEPGWRKAFFVCGGGISPFAHCLEGRRRGCRSTARWRSVSPPAAAPRVRSPPEQAEDLLLLDGFVRRPPPELAVVLPGGADPGLSQLLVWARAAHLVARRPGALVHLASPLGETSLSAVSASGSARPWPASRRACGGAPRPDRRRLAHCRAGRRRRTYAMSTASPVSTKSRRHMRPMLQCAAELLATPQPTRPGPAPKGGAA